MGYLTQHRFQCALLYYLVGILFYLIICFLRCGNALTHYSISPVFNCIESWVVISNTYCNRAAIPATELRSATLQEWDESFKMRKELKKARQRTPRTSLEHSRGKRPLQAPSSHNNRRRLRPFHFGQIGDVVVRLLGECAKLAPKYSIF